MKIPNNFKKYRLEKGLTLKQVAEHLRLDCEDRLSRWENGHTYPHVINLFKLCSLYQMAPSEIYPDLVSIETPFASCPETSQQQ
jgi:transcriptional regulator with XRE-family HTH domain